MCGRKNTAGEGSEDDKVEVIEDENNQCLKRDASGDYKEEKTQAVELGKSQKLNLWNGNNTVG